MSNPVRARTTSGTRDMAVSLLQYANREKVAQALTAQGYQVSRNTVNRWARGDEMPTIAARMIAALFGHGEDAPPARADGAFTRFVERWESDDPPRWAEALTQRIVGEVTQLRDQTRDEAVRAVFDYADAAERGTPPPSASTPDNEGRPTSRPAR